MNTNMEKYIQKQTSGKDVTKEKSQGGKDRNKTKCKPVSTQIFHSKNTQNRKFKNVWKNNSTFIDNKTLKTNEQSTQKIVTHKILKNKNNAIISNDTIISNDKNKNISIKNLNNQKYNKISKFYKNKSEINISNTENFNPKSHLHDPIKNKLMSTQPKNTNKKNEIFEKNKKEFTKVLDIPKIQIPLLDVSSNDTTPTKSMLNKFLPQETPSPKKKDRIQVKDKDTTKEFITNLLSEDKQEKPKIKIQKNSKKPFESNYFKNKKMGTIIDLTKEEEKPNEIIIRPRLRTLDSLHLSCFLYIMG